VAGHTVGDLPARGASGGGGKGGGGGGDAAADIPVLLLIDTAGCGFEEQKEDEGDST
jgi:ATP-dependent RNA/DNA helicase IGHMBP2